MKASVRDRIKVSKDGNAAVGLTSILDHGQFVYLHIRYEMLF